MLVFVVGTNKINKQKPGALYSKFNLVTEIPTSAV